MTHELDAELAEQIRAKKEQQATEQWKAIEQKRLNRVFPALGVAVSRVAAGDRAAMLDFLGIAADSLRYFEVLPQEARDALSDGLAAMQNNLEEAKGFLPRKRGERSAQEKRSHKYKEFHTALAVELRRLVDGLTIEDAVAELERASEMTESVIYKRWKRHHKSAKESVNMMRDVLGGIGVGLATKPNRRKRRI